MRVVWARGPTKIISPLASRGCAYKPCTPPINTTIHAATLLHNRTINAIHPAEDACANLRAVIDAGLHAYFEDFLAETERTLADNDQRGFYKHLKGTVGLGGRKARSEQFIMDENRKLVRDKVRIRKRWGGFFQTLLNRKSPKLDLTITIVFPQRPLAPSLGVEPTMDDMMGVIRGMPNWNAVGPDSLPAEVLKLDHPEFIRYFHNVLCQCAEHWRSPSTVDKCDHQSPP